MGVGDRGGKRSRIVDGERSEAGGEAVGAGRSEGRKRTGGGGSKPSLAAAAELWLGKKLSKRQRMSNWVPILPSIFFIFIFTKCDGADFFGCCKDLRPLSEGQLHYASLDAWCVPFFCCLCAPNFLISEDYALFLPEFGAH